LRKLAIVKYFAGRPNQQVRILASDVSYGQVLWALQRKLGWEIKIPPLADALKVPYVRTEGPHGNQGRIE